MLGGLSLERRLEIMAELLDAGGASWVAVLGSASVEAMLGAVYGIVNASVVLNAMLFISSRTKGVTDLIG